MACHYHPERESTDICAICGKQICKECGLEIAGKVYCKDCLQKIIGIGSETKETPVQEPVMQEPEENIYATPQQEEVQYAPEESIVQEYGVSEDSPYNIKDNIEYSGGLESSYLYEEEPVQQAPKAYAEEKIATPVMAEEKVIPQPVAQEDDFIYPDHSYEPAPTSA